MWQRLALVLFGVAVGVVGLWAGQATIRNQPAASPPDSGLTYAVGQETVERSVPVGVVAERSRELRAVNLLEGFFSDDIERWSRGLSSGSLIQFNFVITPQGVLEVVTS